MLAPRGAFPAELATGKEVVFATHGFNVSQGEGGHALTALERTLWLPAQRFFFVGVLWPVHVYNHAAALAAPWTWAAIHAGFVLFSCVGSVLAWRLN